MMWYSPSWILVRDDAGENYVASLTPVANWDAELHAPGNIDDPNEKGNTLYIAMNRFQVARGREEDFEAAWRERKTYLDDVPGFKEFHLLRGSSNEESTLYASHSQWDTQEAFTAWTKSDAFRQAHGRTHTTKATLVGHPHFEGFEAIL